MKSDLEREIERLFSRAEKFRKLANFWDGLNDDLRMEKAKLMDGLKLALDKWEEAGVKTEDVGVFMRLEGLLESYNPFRLYAPRSLSTNVQGPQATDSTQTECKANAE